MAISLKHAFTSAKSDGGDSTLVQPSNWNAEHVMLLTSGTMVGRSTAGTGAAEEITISSNLSLSGGTLGLASSVSITALTASGAVTAGSLTLGGTAITATGTELNYSTGVTSSIQSQLNARALTTRTITAGNGLTGGGALSGDVTVSHDDTSTQASVSNTGNNFIQGVTLDTYGHVTSLASAAIDIGAAIASMSGDDIGSYVLAQPAPASTITADLNDTQSGANLYPVGIGTGGLGASAGALTGTWRCMGYVGDDTYLSLWMRIA